MRHRLVLPAQCRQSGRRRSGERTSTLSGAFRETVAVVVSGLTGREKTVVLVGKSVPGGDEGGETGGSDLRGRKVGSVVRRMVDCRHLASARSLGERWPVGSSPCEGPRMSGQCRELGRGRRCRRDMTDQRRTAASEVEGRHWWRQQHEPQRHSRCSGSVVDLLVLLARGPWGLAPDWSVCRAVFGTCRSSGCSC